MRKPRVAIVRGKFLNKYEMQFFEPLAREYDITAFGSLTSYHDQFTFPVVKLPSPMDIPEIPFKMQVLNRLFVDAHYLFGLENKLKGLPAQAGFDLVHTAETYFHYTQQCLNAKRKGYVKKVIATVLENIPHNNEGIWGRKAFKARARRELDHIIALTNKTKVALLAEGADPRKITVISHFVDTKWFQPSSETIKRRFEDRKDLTILFVGRLEEYKGVFDVLEAALLLKKEKFDIKWRFIGEGSARNEMLRLEKEYGIDAVHATASYDDMPKEYQHADIFVAPSRPTPTWEEQYCTALLEAQAAGLPIVTTKTGGIPENVGDAARMVAPGDVPALAAMLKEFIVNAALRREFAAVARKRAVTVHDIALGAQKMAELYNQMSR